MSSISSMYKSPAGIEFTEDELKSDTLELRNTAAQGFWPQEMIEKYHPREEFSAHETKLPAPLQMSAVLLQEASVTGFIQLIGYPIQMMCNEFLRWALQDTQNDDGRLNMSDEFKLHNRLFIRLQRSYENVLDMKEKRKVKRPSTYSEMSVEMFGDTYAEPSSRAWVLAQTVNFMANNLEMTDEQITQLQDAAYIVAMLNVLAGHNHITDVLRAFDESEMWGLKGRKSADPRLETSAAEAEYAAPVPDDKTLH